MTTPTPNSVQRVINLIQPALRDIKGIAQRMSDMAESPIKEEAELLVAITQTVIEGVDNAEITLRGATSDADLEAQRLGAREF